MLTFLRTSSIFDSGSKSATAVTAATRTIGFRLEISTSLSDTLQMRIVAFLFPGPKFETDFAMTQLLTAHVSGSVRKSP